jgi:hypothetical protein
LCGEINQVYGGIRFRGHREVVAKECPVFDYRRVLSLDDRGFMTATHPPIAPPSSTVEHKMTITRTTVSATENDRHPDVRIAQGLLLAAGEDPGPVDGIAGRKFTNAVTGFQRANGLVADGMVGPQTWEQLEDAGT